MIQQLLASLVSAMLIMQPLLAEAGSAPRLITTNSVTLVDSGLVVDKEMPVPSGKLMACTGECIIEADGLQLIGADRTVFSFEEGSTRFLVTIIEGRLDFVMRADAKPLAFRTPFQDPEDSNTYLVPASSDEVFKGSLLINSKKDKAILSMTKGSLKLVAIDGQKVVRAGNAIFLPNHHQPAEGRALSLAYGSGSSGAEFSGTALAVGAGALAILGIAGMALAGGGGGGGGGDSEASPH